MPPRRFDEVLIEATPERLRAAAVSRGELVDWLEVPRHAHFGPGSLVYGKVSGAAPDLGAVFVDIGAGRPALLDVRGRPPESGSAILVQIVEAPAGDKGGRVSRRVTLAGRHVVLLPGGEGVKASNRLDDKCARDLSKALQTHVSEGHGLVLRWTAALTHPDAIAAEATLLVRHWQTIDTRRTAASAPALIFDDGDGVLRLLRELDGHGAPQFAFNDLATLRSARAAAAAWFPDLAERMSSGETDIFDRHDIASTLASAESTEVRLPSGGRIVIEPTLACTAIDVDSGSASGGAQARRKTDLEAAREVARQLWLRDIAGMVVVDFIRLENPADRKRVLDTLTAAAATDRVPVQVHGWTRMGLLELVRRRARGGAGE
jgi:Rne/Rng family ribonuclease